MAEPGILETDFMHRFVRINLDVSEIPSPVPENNGAEENQEIPPAQCKEGETKPTSVDGATKIPPELVTQELTKKKSKRKRKRSKHEELYTDKDRAAAVNMGNRDIKQSLKLKRKEDRSKNMLIPEEAEPGTFLALGEYEMRRGDTKMSLSFINKALELNPLEKNALVARSKCYILLAQPEKGLKDAETALTVDKNFAKAVYQKAESLYFLGDFEHSLMYYHRGLKLRPEHAGFKLGVQKAQKAIENAIGAKWLPPQLAKTPEPRSRTRRNTRDDLPTPPSTAKLSTKRTTPDPPGGRTRPATAAPPRQTQRDSTPASKPKSAKKSRLLRELGADKLYLESLINNPSLKCKHKQDDSTILSYVKDAVDFLNSRQEFWRQQLPPNLK